MSATYEPRLVGLWLNIDRLGTGSGLGQIVAHISADYLLVEQDDIRQVVAMSDLVGRRLYPSRQAALPPEEAE